MEDALGLHERLERIRSQIHTIPKLAEPIWHDLESLRTLQHCVAAVDHEKTLNEVKDAISHASEQITSHSESKNKDAVRQNLLSALTARDVQAYQDSFSQALRNQEIEKRMQQLDSSMSQLRRNAPLLAKLLASTVIETSWDLRAEQFASTWNWARAKAWLERLCDPETERQLQLQLDSAQRRIRNCLKGIAAEKAWSYCFDRMTERERQHLVAWSKAVRSIGKGTGKYAPIHRRNAREHLNECRSAIPGWVMPLYRVAETIKPGKDLFDVVIIDEASQSGPEALLLAYLAKKLVVVGDDKQISPTYAGVNHDDVNHLRARHLGDLPHADSYGVQQSFFDLAEIRYQGRIRLREHFRCMPEIIQFSNNLCYQGEPLIPLRQYGGVTYIAGSIRTACARWVPQRRRPKCH